MEICSESFDLGASFFECAGTVDRVGGVLEFFPNGKLGSDAAAGFAFAHAAGAQAFELLFRRAPRDNEAIEPCSHAGFDE